MLAQAVQVEAAREEAGPVTAIAVEDDEIRECGDDVDRRRAHLGPASDHGLAGASGRTPDRERDGDAGDQQPRDEGDREPWIEGAEHATPLAPAG